MIWLAELRTPFNGDPHNRGRKHFIWCDAKNTITILEYALDGFHAGNVETSKSHARRMWKEFLSNGWQVTIKKTLAKSRTPQTTEIDQVITNFESIQNGLPT